jgi:opacity protein-like surface antigen
MEAPPMRCDSADSNVLDDLVDSARVAFVLISALAFCLHCPNPAAAQDEETQDVAPDFLFRQPRVIIGFRGGWAFNRSNSGIHDFLEKHLTLEDSDFDGPAFTLDVGVRTTSWMDVVFGLEVSGRRSKSHFRHFVEDNGDLIDQKTTLTQVPLTSSLKLYPLGRGRQVGKYAWIRSAVVPYVGGGIGATWFKLTQKGDFVDFVDHTIFEAKLRTDGWAFAQHAFVGLDVEITPNIGAVIEGRYYWARANVDQDFVNFGSIDLNGARVMVGVNVRL